MNLDHATRKSGPGQSGILSALHVVNRIRNSPKVTIPHRITVEIVDRSAGIPPISAWLVTPPSEDVQEEQIIQNLLPHSPGAFGVIAGRTGIGKTNVLLNIGHRIATGTQLWGLNCKKVGVAMIAFEGDYYNLKARITKIEDAMLAENSDLDFDLFHFELPRFTSRSPIALCEEVFTRLKDTSGIDVVIFDPIKYVVPGDYLNMKDVKEFTENFMKLLATLNLKAIVSLPVHKPQNKDSLIDVNDVYSIKGATEWVDAATFCLLIEKVAHSPTKFGKAVIGFVKHRNNEGAFLDNLNVKFNHETCMFTTVEKVGTADSIDEEGNIIFKTSW